MTGNADRTLGRRFNDRTIAIAHKASDAWAIQDRAEVLAQDGCDVLFLTVGDPDFATPAAITQAAIVALQKERTHYSPIGGEPQLRQAIADRLAIQTGVQTGPENVAVFSGGQAALFAVAQTLLQTGDELLVPEPYYATYPVLTMAAGAIPVSLPCAPEKGFLLEADDLANALTRNTRAVILNSPANPSGASYSASILSEIVAVGRDAGIWIIADEVYADLSFEMAHASVWSASCSTNAEGNRSIDQAKVAVIGSLSKSHAMTGWRLGWVAGPTDLISHLVTLSEGSQFGVAQFIQDAGVVALTGEHPELAEMQLTYRRRRNLIVDELNAIEGISCQSPQGGMFVLADVRELTSDCVKFAARLLEEENVAVIPGASFGTSARGHLRITLAKSDDVLKEAMIRIARFVKNWH